MRCLLLFLFILIVTSCQPWHRLKQNSRHKEIVFVISDTIHTKQSTTDNTSIQYYDEAYRLINEMLEGARKSSFKDAIFAVENAYTGGGLNYQLYNAQIDQFLFRAQLFEKANDSTFLYYETDRNDVLKHASLFQLFSDTLSFRFNGNEQLHYPFRYDVLDFNGSQSWESTFVSHTLFNHRGNCQSLSYLYKILCDEMGIETHLAIAPNHIYIKHANKKMGMYNTELTNGTFPIDAWVMVTGYVDLQAIRSGIYMKALNEQQSLALCMLDLAKGYERKYGIENGVFMLQCCNKALAYYPNSINAKLLKAKILHGRLNNQPPSLEYQNLLADIYQSGYREMPEEAYFSWLTGKSLQRQTKLQKYPNPFMKYEDSIEVCTFSGGRYDEYLYKDTVLIGSALLDAKTLKVIGFQEPQIYIPAPETMHRFMSVDPLAAKYPWYTPYQFSGNKVIAFRELEGLEEHTATTSSGRVLTLDGPYTADFVQAWAETNEASISHSDNPDVKTNVTFFAAGAGHDRDNTGYIDETIRDLRLSGISNPTDINAHYTNFDDIKFSNSVFSTTPYDQTHDLADIDDRILDAAGQIESYLNEHNTEQVNLFGYSAGSVIFAQAALYLANEKDIIIDNLILLGTTISNDSKLMKALANNPNIKAVWTVTIPGDNVQDGLLAAQSFLEYGDDHPHFKYAFWLDAHKRRMELFQQFVIKVGLK